MASNTGLNIDANKLYESKNDEKEQLLELEEAWRCQICNETMIKACRLGCDHTFCRYCIEDENKIPKEECPLCAAKVTEVCSCEQLDTEIEELYSKFSSEKRALRSNKLVERKRLEDERLKKIQKTKSEENVQTSHSWTRNAITVLEPISTNNNHNGDDEYEDNNPEPVVITPVVLHERITIQRMRVIDNSTTTDNFLADRSTSTTSHQNCFYQQNQHPHSYNSYSCYDNRYSPYQVPNTFDYHQPSFPNPNNSFFSPPEFSSHYACHGHNQEVEEDVGWGFNYTNQCNHSQTQHNQHGEFENYSDTFTFHPSPFFENNNNYYEEFLGFNGEDQQSHSLCFCNCHEECNCNCDDENDSSQHQNCQDYCEEHNNSNSININVNLMYPNNDNDGSGGDNPNCFCHNNTFHSHLNEEYQSEISAIPVNNYDVDAGTQNTEDFEETDPEYAEFLNTFESMGLVNLTTATENGNNEFAI